MLKIKVCGMKDPGNIAEVAKLLPDYMGFLFYEKSPRYAGELDPEAVYDLPDSIRKAGVFVNASPEHIHATAGKYDLDVLQFHGNETPGQCREFLDRYFVVKALSVQSAEDVSSYVRAYEDTVDLLLFDTKTPAYGGSGLRFDWSILEGYSARVPFLLSGGIGPEDPERITNFRHPFLWGVDLNSRFERSPGVKDVDALSGFFEKIRKIK